MTTLFQGSLSDADLAIRLSPTYVKAFIRRARALQSLGDFTGAEAASKDALALEPKNAELKRLVREIQAAEAEAAHEAALVAAAGDDKEAAQMAASALSLSDVRFAIRRLCRPLPTSHRNGFYLILITLAHTLRHASGRAARRPRGRPDRCARRSRGERRRGEGLRAPRAPPSAPESPALRFGQPGRL